MACAMVSVVGATRRRHNRIANMRDKALDHGLYVKHGMADTPQSELDLCMSQVDYWGCGQAVKRYHMVERLSGRDRVCP